MPHVTRLHSVPLATPEQENAVNRFYSDFLDPDTWRVSWHAATRALDMALESDQIIDVLLHPDGVQPSNKYEGCWNYHYGDLCAGVAVDEKPFTVVTFVWNNEKKWREDLGKGKKYDTRRYRQGAAMPTLLG